MTGLIIGVKLACGTLVTGRNTEMTVIAIFLYEVQWRKFVTVEIGRIRGSGRNSGVTVSRRSTVYMWRFSICEYL